ncbi:MAG: hypothetical protein IPP49_04100 [Saprospiraceae bacterium]|nr:hypothetical protein [Saprospiraceae bacterium]
MKRRAFRMSTKYQGNGKYGSSIEISVDNGISYSVLYENPNEEYRLIGTIEDKLIIGALSLSQKHGRVGIDKLVRIYRHKVRWRNANK